MVSDKNIMGGNRAFRYSRQAAHRVFVGCTWASFLSLRQPTKNIGGHHAGLPLQSLPQHYEPTKVYRVI